jgi:PRTRC genetic system protein E
MNVTAPTGGLFSQLAPLLSHRAVLITVSKLDDDVVQVNFCPGQVKDMENQALTAPLCVTGTAAELDHDLMSQIIGFVSAHVKLNSNLAQIQLEVEEAEKAAREEAKKKQKPAGVTARKGSPPSAEEAQPKAMPQQSLSLFDEGPATEPTEELVGGGA